MGMEVVAMGMLAFFSHWEVILIVLLAVLLFGSRIPKLARSLGQGITEFKRGVKHEAKEPTEAPLEGVNHSD